MPRIYISSVIDAPAAKVWERVRDFNGMPRWHPRIRDSRIENGEPSDRVGCVRNFHLKDGGNIREQLLAFSDADCYCTYTILNSPLPIVNYVSTIRLRPVTDGDRTYAEWSATFDVEADQKEAMEQTLTRGVYRAGFDALKAHFGG